MSSPSSFGEGPVPSRETPEIEEFVGSFTQMCDKLSRRIRQLEDENDRLELLESYGQRESGLVQLIHAAYDTLGLQSYLTAGEQEVRAGDVVTMINGQSVTSAADITRALRDRQNETVEIAVTRDRKSLMLKARVPTSTSPAGRSGRGRLPV